MSKRKRVMAEQKVHGPDLDQKIAASPWNQALGSVRGLGSAAVGAKLPSGVVAKNGLDAGRPGSTGRRSTTGTTVERELYARARTLDTEDVERMLDLVQNQVGRTDPHVQAKNTANAKWYITHPHSLFHGFWDIFIASILLVTFVLMPLNFFDDFASGGIFFTGHLGACRRRPPTGIQRRVASSPLLLPASAPSLPLGAHAPKKQKARSDWTRWACSTTCSTRSSWRTA